MSGALFAIVAQPASAQSRPAQAAAIVEGRCLAAEDHTPLAGVVV